MLPINKIEEAAIRLQNILVPTPLIFSDFLSEEHDCELYIKPENLQRTGAFKIRGSYNKIASLKETVLEKGIVAASAGNHAQGVALAAKSICDPSKGSCPLVTIVMPETTPYIKVEGTQKLGAKVVLSGDNYDEAYAEARRIETEDGALFVHPFDDLDVIAGQGTIGLEILEELDDIDMVIVPIGGGGLIAGIAAAIKQVKPEIEVVGVEPEGAASMTLSLKYGEVTELEEVNTIADGVAVKRVGDLPFALITKYVDKIVTVSDTEIMDALLVLMERQKLVAENAGACSVAALKKIDTKGKRVVSLVSGGNIDVITISEMLNRGMVSRGRLFSFSVELQHKPGELLKISSILAEAKANIVKLDHDQFHNPARFKSVRLAVTVETNGISHVNNIVESLEFEGYVVERLGV
jgi:threonine dehydratase